MLKFFLTGGLCIIGAGAGFDWVTDSYVFTRNLRTALCGLKILYSYKIKFSEKNYLEIHEDIAKSIYNSTR